MRESSEVSPPYLLLKGGISKVFLMNLKSLPRFAEEKEKSLDFYA